MNRACVASLLLLATLALPAAAQPLPVLVNVAPIYLRQGETREIALSGQNLADAHSVMLVDARGLTATLLPAGKRTEPRKMRLVASADTALGDRELRVATPTGMTQPLHVTVGTLPSIEEVEPNDSGESAQRIALPVSILGRIDRPGDTDLYRFAAKKDQHLIFDVHGLRLGSPLTAVLTLRDGLGHELPILKSDHAGDPMAVFDPPADGDYVLEIRDLRYRGGGDFAYRIEAGEIPYVEAMVPMSAPAGQKLEVTAIGHNLRSGRKFSLDLTTATVGRIPVRVTTPLGQSNEVSFFVTEPAGHSTSTPSTTPSTQPTKIALPWDETGVLATPGIENAYLFNVAIRQPITLAVTARAVGSPVDALLTLRTAAGQMIEQSNGMADFEAKISRVLEPGDYSASIRDLTFAGGPSYVYRLSFGAEKSAPEFAMRFMPDNVRVSRGGSAKMWCEISRAGGLRGPVSLSIDGLPPGVTVTPSTIEESTSGIFTLTASPDAEPGNYAIRIKGTGKGMGANALTRTADAELNNRIVRQAWVTITEAAPVTLDAVGTVRPEAVAEYPRQVAELQAKLAASGPQFEAAQAEWEKQFRGTGATSSPWVVLTPSKMESTAGATLTRDADDSIHAAGSSPERDTFNVTASTTLRQITAIRLEALSDSTLPANGPGRSPNGNFVLSKLTVTASPLAQPEKCTPVSFQGATATFEQQQYPAASAVGAGAGGGWAVVPETGKSHVAVFRLAAPIDFEAGTLLHFSLDQQFGGQHVMGRWRLSVTSDPKAAVELGGPTLPGKLLAIVRTAADQRSAEQRDELATYYRTVSPELVAARARLETLRQTVGPLAEIARLEVMLQANTPQLTAEQAEWEKAASGGTWTVPNVTQALGSNGVTLTKEADGSLLATGVSPANSTYYVTASTTLKQITGVRLEVLPDERLPGGGPGRASDGNFILSGFKLSVQPSGKQPAGTASKADVAFASVAADFEQQQYGVKGVLDADNATGWAVAPNTSRPLSAIFVPVAPVACGEGSRLVFTLDQLAPKPQYTLGHFRLWITGSANPQCAAAVPPEIAAILRTAPEKRTEDRKAALAAYHRSIAPSLNGVRQRLAELRSALPASQLATPRNRTISIPVPLTRRPGFTGDVTVTLEGFAAGRDPVTRLPVSLAKFFVVTPLTIKGTESAGKLNVKINGNSEVGTRMIVLKAETKIGNDTWVQYSPAFPITVTEK